MDVCVPCGNAPPKWRHVIVDGKKKRKCEWVDENGCECPKTILDAKRDMEAHWRTHTKEKPYKCSKCPQAFAQPTNRDIHERIHDNDKQHKCDFPGCEKAFTQASHLTYHKRTHTEERPFKCKYPGCDQAFTTTGNLDKHLDIHKGSKRFKCNYTGCGLAFTQDKTRKAHEDTHYGIVQKHQCKGSGTKDCPFDYQGSQKYDYRCVKCFVANFPNDPRSDEAKKHLHAKELAVRAFLQETFPQYRWVFDRTCAVGELVRPDARTVLSKTRILIVEVDEESHNTYVCGDERERERIFKEHAPKDAIIHLIRFNPDAYDDPVTGKRVPSCFRYSKVEALVTVHPDRKADWDHRLDTLRSTIQEIIDHQREDIAVPECIILDKADDDRHKYVIPIELFYDNVREKWPDGNKQRAAALKRNKQRS